MNSLFSHSLPLLPHLYTEQAFFQRWWSEQPAAKKIQVQALVTSGQLEFINGGWSMHDEACPSFVDMLDNTALGGRLIWNSFGVSPRTTWQIDPFGHSAFQGSMLSTPLAGVNGVYVARMDYQDIEQRKTYKGTEMFWAPSPSQPLQGGVLGFLPFWYYAPGGFDFGGDDRTQPVMDDEALEDYNVADVVARFNALIDNQVNFTAGEDMMIMMATDFSGENGPTWYRNIDKLIHYVNLAGGPGGGGKYHALYSTPSAYTAAKAASTPLPLREEDVMPYADDAHAFWSGYFSSRMALKGYVRDSSAVFQAAKQIQVASTSLTSSGGPNPDDSSANQLYLLERAMGVTQHHDAVSGTSKQHVAYDYARRLAGGRLAADESILSGLTTLTGEAVSTWASCDLANVTICPSLENGPTTLLLWNQQSQAIYNAAIRIPVRGGTSGWIVRDESAVNIIQSQTLVASVADYHLRNEYYGYKSPVQEIEWLHFKISIVPAMGYSVVFLTPGTTTSGALKKKVLKTSSIGSVSNGLVNMTFGTDNRLTTLNGHAFINDFFYYNASVGGPNDGTGDWQQQSGAYIFRTNSTTSFPVGGSVVTAELIASGPVVWEVRQTFGPWISQSIRLWANSNEIEFEHTVGPIPINGNENPDGEGHEIISRYSTDLKSNAMWNSDSNGRDAILRKRDSRFSFNYSVYEKISGNYVPVNLFQSLNDTSAVLNVVVDRTQGGSSMTDGSLEFMVHRRLAADDSRGVGEPLNETGLDGNGLIVRSLHRVQLVSVANGGQSLRTSAASSLFRPVAMFEPTNGGSKPTPFTTNYTLLRSPLPPSLHAVTLQSLGGKELLVRIAHMYAVNEDSILSQDATVSLANLLVNPIASCIETILPGTLPLASAPVTSYQMTNGESVTLPVLYPQPEGPSLDITLSAMQIRTFKCMLA